MSASPLSVILAGGRGTRLAPYTKILPKPLIPIGERAILEIVVDQLAARGLREIVVSVGYLAHLIEAVFGDGSSRGVRIRYLYEHEPLGTAGPLRRLPPPDGDFLLMNGDVLTTLDHGELLRWHAESANAMTIATHRRIARIDYGVLSLDGSDGALRRVAGYDEKPEIPSIVSMGVYALSPRALLYIPDDRAFDIPDLVRALLAAGEPIGAYQFDGLWLDVGRPEDHQRAVELLSEFDVAPAAPIAAHG